MKLDVKALSEKLAKGILDQAEADRGTLNLENQQSRIRQALTDAVENGADPQQMRLSNFSADDVGQLVSEVYSLSKSSSWDDLYLRQRQQLAQAAAPFGVVIKV